MQDFSMKEPLEDREVKVGLHANELIRASRGRVLVLLVLVGRCFHYQEVIFQLLLIQVQACQILMLFLHLSFVVLSLPTRGVLLIIR